MPRLQALKSERGIIKRMHVMQLRAARAARRRQLIYFNVPASARCHHDFVLETCSELRASLLPAGLVSLFVTTWQVSAPVLALIILRPGHPDEAMCIFGSKSEFRKATGRVNIQPLGQLYD